MRNFTIPLLLSALTSFCFAADYYVSPSGDDANPGTLSQPFQTISAAAAIMQAGDTCYIRAGTYRETVTPANSGEPGAPITFMPFNGESVTISGAEVITGWRATEASDDIHHPNIYVAPMGWDLGDGSNQVFVDGEWNVHRARWPNLGENPDRFAPPLASGSASGGKISFSVTRPENYWVGGTVMGWFVKKWLSTGGIISASTPSGELTLSERTSVWFDDEDQGWLDGSGEGFITGVLGELDSAGEWFLKDGSLYLWAPGDVNPSSLLVEAKARKWCFNINDKDFIHVRDINMFAGSINLLSNYSLIEACEVKYLSHFTFYDWGYSASGEIELGNNGIRLKGNHNIIRNCTISESTGNGLLINGSNNLIIRNLIENCNYSGSYASPLGFAWGGGGNNRILLNTLRHAGRDVLKTSNASQDIIMYNRISDAGYLASDLGIIYHFGTDGNGTVIAYNWLHDNYWDADYYADVGPGIYSDNYSREFIMHNNVIWNCVQGIRHNEPHDALQIYNNTLFDCLDIGVDSYNNWDQNSGPSWWRDLGYGNVANSVKENNLFLADNPGAQLKDWQNEDFSLKTGAASIDSGVEVSGITDGFFGSAPDQGAYEVGEFYWVPGHNGHSYQALGLTASIHNGGVVLNWDQNTEPEFSSYRVYRSSTSDGPWIEIASGLSTSTYTDTSGFIGTEYFYKVAFVDHTATAHESGEVISAIPALGISIDVSYEQITLAGIMDAFPDTVSYAVSRALASDGVFYEIATGQTSNNFTDSSVTNAAGYFYRLSLVDSLSSTTESPVIGPLTVPEFLASWDVWNGAVQGAKPSAINADFTAAGISAFAGTSVDPTYATIGGGIDAQFYGSRDGTFGNLSLPAADTTAWASNFKINMLQNNGNNRRLDFSLTNNTGADVQLDAFYFDYNPGNLGSQTVELRHLKANINGSGVFTSDLTDDNNTVIGSFTSIASNSGEDFHDVSIRLSDGLTDSVLADGESVAFRIEIPETGEVVQRFGIDNVAITGAVVGLDPGEYSNWATLYFGGAAGTGAKTADYDQDGIVNLKEFMFGTNPVSANGDPVTAGFENAGDKFSTMTYRRRVGAAITYTVQVSADFQTWTDISRSDGATSEHTYTLLSDSGDEGDGYQTMKIRYNVALENLAQKKLFLRLHAEE